MAHNRKHGRKFKRGKWRVERERHHLSEPRPRPDYSDPVQVSGLVESAMKRLGLDRQHWLESLTQTWSDIVGPSVAQHTRPGRVEDGTLFVFVDSSAWLSELSRYGQREILTNLKTRYGPRKVRAVSLQLDPDAVDRDTASGFLSRWKKEHPRSGG